MRAFSKNECLLRKKPGYLVKGMIHAKYFRLLIDLSSIRSSKGIYALEDYLVKGRDLKEICNEYGITQSYFTGLLSKLQEFNYNVINILPYYRC